MYKSMLTMAAGAVAGFAAAGWIYTAASTTDKAAGSTQSASSFDSELPVEERVATLELAVSDERFARQLLQEEVFYLTSELERLSLEREFAQAEEIRSGQADDDSIESRESRREAYRSRNSLEGRVERLIEAGFLPSQASMIVQRESELQMEALMARYAAERSGEPLDYFRSRSATYDALREELGEADYERYLVANDRSTSITVSSVIESSPAQTAGLQAGDQIVRYDGERVFSMTDLTRQTMDGVAGQNVVVDIVRDGTPMQVVLPRGPVGITGGRRGR